jgi:hypothetical protein
MSHMKRIVSLIGMFVVLLVGTAAQAQDFRRNAYGMYAAPTIYGFAQGSEYNVASSSAGLDLGGYYSRFFTPSFSARLEVRYGTRVMDDITPSELFPGSYVGFRLEESILEVPIILEGDRRIPVGDHEVRVSVGAGVSAKFVLDQKLLEPGGELPEDQGFKAADSYRKVGLLVDGGTTFNVDRRSSIFLRLRVDFDVATAGEPEDATAIRRFWAAGFYAGFEYGL